MKKCLLLLTLVSAIFFELSAQSPDPQKNPNDIFFNNHVIRVYQTSSSGYLYDVYSKGQLVIHQNINPFTGDQAGLKLKEDAIKLAKWQILQLYPTQNGTKLILTKLPMAVAHQLNITTN